MEERSVSTVQRFKAELKALTTLGGNLAIDLALRLKDAHGELNQQAKDIAKEGDCSFEDDYQRWYTQSRAVIKQLVPDRLQEFDELYRGDGRRKRIALTTYHIQDWLNGVRSGRNTFGEKAFDDLSVVCSHFTLQFKILESVATCFDSTLFNIKQMAQADLFDSELDAARELAKHGFLRSAGVLAGVVLERHLSQVMQNHSVTTRKKSPTIGDFNERLRQSDVLDVPSWRQIQRLGDIRNLCGHNKEREPTREEVGELIDGVEKYTKTLF